MKILNPGEWAKNALQLWQSPEEYPLWEASILQRETNHWEKLASYEAKHSMAFTVHYWLVEGHPIIVWVSKDTLPFIPMG
jgi:hypothetical protein